MKCENVSYARGLGRFGKVFGLLICLLHLSINATYGQVISGNNGPNAAPVPQTVSLYLSIPDPSQIVFVFPGGVPYFKLAGANSLVSQYNVKNFELAFPNARFEYLRNLYSLTCSSVDFGIAMKAAYPTFFPFWEQIPTPIPLTDYYPNDTGTAQVAPGSWKYLQYIGAPRAWGITKGSPNTLIGITDSYVDTQNPELSTKLSSVAYNTNSASNHGTAVCGLAAAATDDGYGIPSIGFNCRIKFIGKLSTLEMLKLSNDGAKVLNGSWMSGQVTSTYETLRQSNVLQQIQQLTVYENGTVACYAAGNRDVGPPQSYGPQASLDYVLSVSNIGWKNPYNSPNGTTNVQDVYETVKGDSDVNCHWRNHMVDILAPGRDITVLGPNNQFRIGSGTSVASPIVAGTVALMQTANPCLSPYQIEYILKESADKTVLSLPENIKYAGRLGAGKLEAGVTLENVKLGVDSPNNRFNCNNPATQTFRILGIEFNTLCAPGVGPGGLKPQLSLLLGNGTPPYTYRWEALPTVPGLSGNQTQLSSTKSANPTIDSSWGDHLAYYLVTAYDASPVQKVASLVFKAKLITDSTSSELAMRDSYYDVLDEPNSMYTVDRHHWDIWRSPDLWNRQYKDGITTHEDPEYFATDSNYLYVRIRNVGCAVSKTSRLTLHWAKASTGEHWPYDWNGSVQVPAHPSGWVSGGGTILGPFRTNDIPAIAPGDQYIYTRGWRPPNPDSFAGKPVSVDACLLARLLEGGIGFTNPAESDTVKLNVLRRNNIVTRNLLITNLNPIDRSSGTRQVDFVNGGDFPGIFTLQFIGDRHINKHLAGNFGSIGTIKIKLGALYDRWVEGGKQSSSELTILADEKAILTDGSSPIRLDNLSLDAHERFPVDVTFELLPDMPIPDLSFDFFLQQFLQSGDTPDSLLDLDKVYGAVGLNIITGSGEAARPANALEVKPAPTVANALVLYPNPTGDVLKVAYPTLQETGSLTIYDITGRVMQTASANQNGLTALDVAAFTPGIYLVELRSGSGEVMRKMFTKK